jgi:mono/diheme cytochrome c family protein
MRSSHVLAATGLVLVGFATIAAQSQRVPGPAAAAVQPSQSAAISGNVEHGRYIAEQVAMCVECHSGRDKQGNIIDSERYLGAPIPAGPPWAADWALRAPRNKGLPGYDDAMAMRLLTEGSIGRDGQPLKLPMPRFRMTPQDAADVIVFLRSLP